MEKIKKQLKKIEEKWGINAYNDIMKYFYTLIRKIEDLIVSRDNWKNKYAKIKKGGNKK
jgi:hypothetical protein